MVFWGPTAPARPPPSGYCWTAASQHGHIELLGQSLDMHPGVLARVGALVESPSLYLHLGGRHDPPAQL